jgi:type IV pilus assembly protein PilV
MIIFVAEYRACESHAGIWDCRDRMMLFREKYQRLETACRRLKNHCGFTLLEVLVAMAVLAFGILAVGSMQVTSIRQNAHADQVTEASVLARDRLESLMALVYTDSDLTESTYDDDDPPTGYTISWEICDGGNAGCDTIADTKLIEVTVQHDKLNRDMVLTNIKPGPP